MPKRSRLGLSRMIRSNMEKKYKDTYNSQGALAAGDTYIRSAGRPGHLIGDNILQNAAATGRVGQRIFVDSIAVKIRVRMVPIENTAVSGLRGNNLVRVVILQDKMSNGTEPDLINAASTVSAVLVYPSASADVTAMRNLASTGRYRILYDRIHSLSSQWTSGTGAAAVAACVPTMKTIAVYKKFKKPIQVKYVSGGTTGVYTEIQSNALWCCMLADYNNDSATYVQIHSRMRFTDA